MRSNECQITNNKTHTTSELQEVTNDHLVMGVRMIENDEYVAVEKEREGEREKEWRDLQRV
jgi:hypothetical protein